MYCPKVPTIVWGNIISTIEIPPFNENPQTKIKRRNSDTKVCCLATLLSFTRQAKFVVSEQSWKILSNTLLQLDLQIYYFIKYNHSSITSLYGTKLHCEIDYFLIYLYLYCKSKVEDEDHLFFNCSLKFKKWFFPWKLWKHINSRNLNNW